MAEAGCEFVGCDGAGLFGCAFAPVEEGGRGQDADEHQAWVERSESLGFFGGEGAAPCVCGELEERSALGVERGPLLFPELSGGFHDGFSHGFEGRGFGVLGCELPELFECSDLF